MMPPQVTFVHRQSSGRSSKLQQSNARAHAARVGHLRLKSRTKPKDKASSGGQPTKRTGQATFPIRTWRVQRPPLSPTINEISSSSSPASPEPHTTVAARVPLTPPLQPHAVDEHSFQEQHDGDHPQEEDILEDAINPSLAPPPLQQSSRTTPPRFKISL